jgi:carbon-monoxide dehydrogenase large subunit
MPRASDLPAFHTTFIATPAPSNPLGVKGASESGAIGAPAAIGNAVIDALWHLGVRDITLPITSETVWRALHDGQRGDTQDRNSLIPTTGYAGP